jgi:hypothetical protein
VLDNSRSPKQLVNLGVALVPQAAGAASLAPAYREPSIVSSIKTNKFRIA